VTSKSVFHGRVLDVRVDRFALPNGRTVTLEVVRHPGGAACVAVDALRRVCLLRQFRHTFSSWLWELPAGRVDPGEGPLATAQRELREEAGLYGGEWTPLGTVIPTPGFCDEVIHLFLARATVPGRAQLEEDELLEVHWVGLEEAVERVLDGRITDAKTVVALLRAERVLRASTP
jgi:ADP-ribose pyrophosphatase